MAFSNFPTTSPSGVFVHHVYFWLKNPGSSEDRAALLGGLQKLSKAGMIRQYHIGLPADTNRDVIETSYAVSWLLLFDTAEDQASYQTDPIHLQFVKECSALWSKVVVYDSVDARDATGASPEGPSLDSIG